MRRSTWWKLSAALLLNVTIAHPTTAQQRPEALPTDTLPPKAPKVVSPMDSSAASPEPVAPMPVDDTGMTLDECQFLAQTGNPALREASAKVGVAQGQAVQVGIIPNPTFFTSSPQWAGSISQYNWVFAQDFITAHKLGLNRAVAYRAVEQAQLDFTRTRFEVLTNVRKAYYMAAAAQRRVEVLQELMTVSGRSRDVGQKLLQAGETNRADAVQLEIEYDKASVAHANALATVAAARKQLAAAIGVPEMEIGRLKFDFTLPLPDYELEAVRQGVVDRNSVAHIAAVEIQKTQWALRRARAEPWPNFNIQAGYQYAVEAPRHDQGYAQLTTSIPLYNRNQGGIRSARSDIARATAALQRTENELSQQAAQALGVYIAAGERAKIYQEKILPKAQEVFRVNRSLFEQGQTDFLRLLQAQRTLIEADLGYIEAQESRWTAAAEIAGLLQVEQFP